MKSRSEKPGEFALDLRNGGKDTAGHPWPPVGVMRDTTILTGDPDSIETSQQNRSTYSHQRLAA